MDASLKAEVEAWIADDPDPRPPGELQKALVTGV